MSKNIMKMLSLTFSGSSSVEGETGAWKHLLQGLSATRAPAKNKHFTSQIHQIYLEIEKSYFLNRFIFNYQFQEDSVSGLGGITTKTQYILTLASVQIQSFTAQKKGESQILQMSQ